VLTKHLLLVGLASIGAANAAVTFSQAGNVISMTLSTESYLVTDTQDASDIFVAFKDVFSVGDAAFASAIVGGQMSYSINGGGPTIATWWSGWNYRSGDQGPWTTKDAVFLLDISEGTFEVGDTITFSGELQVNTSFPNVVLPSNMDPGTVTTVLGTGGNYISAPQTTAFNTVPEPTAPLLFSIAGLGLLVRRKRRA
jgi:hypothetical protein